MAYEIPDGWTAQAYRFTLDPTPSQVRMLDSHCGAARFAYNHMLAHVTAVAAQRAAERSYGLTEAELTPAQGWSLAKLRKTWNQHKHTVAPWWEANSKEAYNSGLDALARRPPTTGLETDVEPPRRPAPSPPWWRRQEAMKRQPRMPIRRGPLLRKEKLPAHEN